MSEMSEMSKIKNISLFIPHIFATYSKDYVSNLFESRKIGKVENIDFVCKIGKTGELYNATYIHFKYWFNTIEAKKFQKTVLNGKGFIIYKDDLGWIVLENKTRKFLSGDRKKCIDIGGNLTSLSVSNTKTEKENSSIEIQPVLNVDTTLEAEIADIEAENAAMDEIDEYLENQDKLYVEVHSDYIRALEEENKELSTQLIILSEQNKELSELLGWYQNMLSIEQIKSRSLAEVIKQNQK